MKMSKFICKIELVIIPSLFYTSEKVSKFRLPNTH